MKIIVLLAATVIAFPAWGQAEKPAAQEPAKPPVQEAAKPTVKMAKKPNPKRFEDARHCLERPNNTEVIKCAEAYL